MCVSEPVCARVRVGGGSWGCFLAPLRKVGRTLSFLQAPWILGRTSERPQFYALGAVPAREVRGLPWVPSGARWVMNPPWVRRGRGQSTSLAPSPGRLRTLGLVGSLRRVRRGRGR